MTKLHGKKMPTMDSAINERCHSIARGKKCKSPPEPGSYIGWNPAEPQSP